MPQDAFTLRHIKNCLSKKLTGGKISKVNQPDKNEIVLFIYTENGTVKLKICTSAKNNCVNIVSDEKNNPKVAPAFCMLLRKHLQNAEILNVGQIGFERIIYFDLKCFSEFSVSDLRLYCEIMGKYSNIVLTENGIILGALKCTSLETNMKRILFPGAKYTLPQPQDKIDPSDLRELEKLFSRKFGDASEFISDNVSGIATTTANEMVDEFGENITAKQVYEYVFSNDVSPCITFDENGYKDFKVRSNSANKIKFDDLLQAQTTYYAYAQEKQIFITLKTKLNSALNTGLKKVEKRLAAIVAKLYECERAEEIKLYGELITANIYALNKGDDECIAINYYDETQPTVKIKLDKRLTPAQNAQQYYKKYAKLKRTQESLTEQKQTAEKLEDYFNSIKTTIELSESTCDLVGIENELTSLGLLKQTTETKKNVQIKTPFRRYNVNGFRILVGRNNVQNDDLVRSSSPDDLWLHAKKYHSSHAVVQTDGKSVPEEVIKVAAEICAYYSAGRNSDKIAVDYTYKKNVKKPNKSNIGFVTYNAQNTIIVHPNNHEELKEEN